MKSAEQNRADVLADRAVMIAAKLCIRCRKRDARRNRRTCLGCGRVDACRSKARRNGGAS